MRRIVSGRPPMRCWPVGRVLGYLYTQSRGSAPKYRTWRVQARPPPAAVSATGSPRPWVVVQVGSRFSGQIKLKVELQLDRQENQVIAGSHPDIFEGEGDQAKADLDSSAPRAESLPVGRARPTSTTPRGARRGQGVPRSQGGAVRGAKARLMTGDGLSRPSSRTIDTSQATYDQALAQLDPRAREQRWGPAQSAVAQLRVAAGHARSARAQVKQKDAALKRAGRSRPHSDHPGAGRRRGRLAPGGRRQTVRGEPAVVRRTPPRNARTVKVAAILELDAPIIRLVHAPLDLDLRQGPARWGRGTGA